MNIKETELKDRYGFCVDVPRDNTDIYPGLMKTTFELDPQWSFPDITSLSSMPGDTEAQLTAYVSNYMIGLGIDYESFEIDHLKPKAVNIGLIGWQSTIEQVNNACLQGKLYLKSPPVKYLK